MINQHSVLPLYYQVMNDLLSRIRQREFLPGGQLPSESALSREYGVSRQAMRHALSDLASQGVVRPRRGIGWFVSGERLVKPLPILTSYSAQMGAVSPDTEVKLLSCETTLPDPAVAQALRLEDSAQVVRIDRLGTLAGDPVTLLTAFIPADLCPGLESLSLDGRSLYALLAQTYGVRFVRASSRLEVTFADPTQARLLQVKEGHPLLRLEGISYTSKGRPGEFTALAYPHERIRFTIESYRDEARRRSMLGSQDRGGDP
jgi:DNA-binding GntR family transcriptional regulator